MTLDPVVAMLVRHGLRVTRSNYLMLAYPERSPELDAEAEAIVREALAQRRAAVAAEKAIRLARRR